ncbi:MAG: ATP-dependent Clp protease proteolytic subunit, partial [Desulfurococcaceae archaeon]
MKKFFYSAVLVSLVVTAIFFVTAFKSKSDNKVILSSKNTLTLRGEIDGNNVSKLIKEAIDLNAELEDGKPIYLVLDTPGGSIMDGYQFIDVLKSMGRPVHTISISSMSMGFQIVQALDRRYVFPSSVLMSHRANGSI